MKVNVFFAKQVSLFAVFLFLSGCASKIMTQAQPITSIPGDKSLVTFLLPSSITDLGSAGMNVKPIEFDIWDKETFVGALSKKTFVQYLTDPGEHLFIARGDNWSFLKSELGAGKQYYVVVNILPGLNDGRVVLQPVKKQSEEFLFSVPKWLSILRPMTVISENADKYTKKRMRRLQHAIKKYNAGEVKVSVLEEQDGA